MSTVMPRIHLGDWANDVVNWLEKHWQGFFDGLASAINHPVDWIADPLKQDIPVIGIVIAAGLIAWLTRGWIAAVLSAVGFLLIDGFDQFEPMIDTLSQVLVGSVIAIALAIPLGIWAARSKRASTTIRPILDFMQTLPPYVYVLPGLFLMGLGAANAVLATVVFAMPPGVRLTELGIRQVDDEMVEAGQAFGATPREVLRGVQMPLALPSIMAGINQVIMLALSMVVIAAAVGSPGLGAGIFQALSQSDVGPGVEAGVSVVILAIYLDRVTDGLTKPDTGLVSEVKRIRNRFRQQPATAVANVGQ
jgi:ABC-type proline/glycine betaine transport system permease subunit